MESGSAPACLGWGSIEPGKLAPRGALPSKRAIAVYATPLEALTRGSELAVFVVARLAERLTEGRTINVSTSDGCELVPPEVLSRAAEALVGEAAADFEAFDAALSGEGEAKDLLARMDTAFVRRVRSWSRAGRIFARLSPEAIDDLLLRLGASAIATARSSDAALGDLLHEDPEQLVLFDEAPPRTAGDVLAQATLVRRKVRERWAGEKQLKKVRARVDEVVRVMGARASPHDERAASAARALCQPSRPAAVAELMRAAEVFLSSCGREEGDPTLDARVNGEILRVRSELEQAREAAIQQAGSRLEWALANTREVSLDAPHRLIWVGGHSAYPTPLDAMTWLAEDDVLVLVRRVGRERPEWPYGDPGLPRDAPHAVAPSETLASVAQAFLGEAIADIEAFNAPLAKAAKKAKRDVGYDARKVISRADQALVRRVRTWAANGRIFTRLPAPFAEELILRWGEAVLVTARAPDIDLDVALGEPASALSLLDEPRPKHVEEILWQSVLARRAWIGGRAGADILDKASRRATRATIDYGFGVPAEHDRVASFARALCEVSPAYAISKMAAADAAFLSEYEKEKGGDPDLRARLNEAIVRAYHDLGGVAP